MPSAAFLDKGATAVALVKAGKSYRQIAEALDCSVSTAHHYVVTSLRWAVGGRAGGEEVFWTEVARLDAMIEAIWPKVVEGDLPSIDRALRISARRAALYGLDAPTKISVQQVPEEAIDHAIAERRQAIRLLRSTDTQAG
jgi:hypothetical protein